MLDAISVTGMELVCPWGEGYCPLDTVEVVDENPPHTYLPDEILRSIHHEATGEDDPITEETVECLNCIYQTLDALRCSECLAEQAMADQAEAFLRDNAYLFSVPELIGTQPQIVIVMI